MSDQRRWEAEKARQAPELRDEYLERLVEDVPADSQPRTQHSGAMETGQEQELSEEDYVLAQEEHELQALVAAMEEEERNCGGTAQHYGSDDDDYDQIFLECLAGERAQQPSFDTCFDDPDAMDMS